MKRPLSRAAALLASAVGSVLLGCQEPVVNAIDSGVNVDPDLAGGTVTTTKFRIGHFILGPGPFDICLKGPTDADFSGPFVLKSAMRPGGVPYANVSAYMETPATNYTVRVVPGTRGSCNKLGADLPDLGITKLQPGRHYTIAAMGDLARISTIKFSLIEDDLSVQGGQARMRFINASADVSSADLGFGSGAQWTPQLTDAIYGSVGLTSGLAYLTTPGLSNGTVAVRQSGTATDSLTITSKVNIAPGTVASTIFSGLADISKGGFSLIVCNDSAPTQNGLTPCIELLK